MKKLICGFALLVLLTPSCSKDTYEDSIVESNYVRDPGIKKVSLNEVPFLRPTIEKFKRHNQESRTINDLHLDLDNILAYIKANGDITYNIAIIGTDFSEKEDYYFETLHIVKTQDEYKSFVAKYNQSDDTKNFDASTFTGTIEYSDIEYVKKRIVEFENGDIKKIKSDEADTGENYDNQEEARWGLWDTIKCFLFNLCDEEGNGPYHSGGSNGSSSGSSGSNNSGGPSGSNNPHSSGHVVIISPFYFGSDNNQQGTNNQNTNNPSGTSGSYAGYTTVANESWPSPEETNQLTRADLIVRRLGLPNDHLWLKNSTNQNNPIIFSYLYENSGAESYTEANEVAKLAIRDMKRNPTLFSSMNPFIILNKINSNSLDACTKGIFNRLKNLSGNDIPTIMARFDAPESIFNINMSQGTVEQEQGMIRLAQTTPTSATNYDIVFNQDHFKDSGITNLLKAQAIVHEIFHALIFSIVRNPSNPNLDSSDFPTIWNAYVNHEFGDDEEGHHLFLANNYVNVIGAILQEYDTGVPVVGNNVSQLYRDMAWAGLTPIPVPVQSPFHNMLSGEDQARLYGRFHAELTRAEFNDTQPSSLNPCRN